MDRLPKSILKKTQTSATPKPTPSAKEAEQPQAPPQRDVRHDKNMGIALMHARRIQQQKDFEKRILDSMFTLLDLPRASDADPANPSQSDAAEFKEIVGDFRPRDYEDLMEERNASGQCGYPLCPKPRLKFKGDGIYKIVFEKEGPKTVVKKELERFCSEGCTRRAMYIKLQLLEEGAIDGPGTRSQPIVLYGETSGQVMSLPLRPKEVNAVPPPSVDQEEVEIKDPQTEAMEQFADLVLGPNNRADEGNGLVKARIVEKGHENPAMAPNVTSDGISYDLIEGHPVQHRSLTKAREDP